MLSLELPHSLGDSNEYTQYTIFNIKKENHPKLSQICSYEIFSNRLRKEFQKAVVNEPSVFEPLNSTVCRYFIPFYKQTIRTHGKEARSNKTKIPQKARTGLFKTNDVVS